MKYHSFIFNCLLILVFLGFLTGCKKEKTEVTIGNWVELSDFDGVPRCDAVGFSIGDKGYVGTGYDGTYRLSDFWEYNPQTNNWSQLADFPGVARNAAIGFRIAAKGYLGTGYNGTEKLKDFWEYDPGLNSWTRKADFGGSARYSAVGFSINNIGFVGTGFDGTFLKDFWAYNPELDSWEQKISIGGSKRKDAIGFVISGKGYICTGVDNGVYQYDLWEYTPESGLWAGKRSIYDITDQSFDDNYSGIIGSNKVAFTVNGKAYVATGGAGTSGVMVWEYDPVNDLWTKKTDFEGSDRIDAVAFTIGNRGYVTTGRNSSYYFDDIWAFDPDDTYNEYD